MTTKEQIDKRARLVSYENIYIKRRYPEGYESSWLDVTKYLLDSSVTIEKKLDFEDFGYGEFKTSNAEFTVNNLKGEWNNEADIYSMFFDTISRHYTKVLYKAGYYDDDNVKIDETVFNGLINQKSFSLNFGTGELNFTAYNVQSAFGERTTGGLTGSDTFKNLIPELFDSFITEHVTYNAAKINPETDISFDSFVPFSDRIMSDILTDICKKANSVWYVDDDLELVIKSRNMIAGTPHLFLGGYRGDRGVNILDVESYENGYTNIINQVKYTSGSNEYQYSADSANLDKYGTNKLELSGEDLTNTTTISNLCTNIITKAQTPKLRVVLTTVYMPNVIGLLEECQIDYSSKVRSFINFPLLWINRDNINDGKYISYFENRLIIKPETEFVYFGFQHDVKGGITRHYLMENW